MSAPDLDRDGKPISEGTLVQTETFFLRPRQGRVVKQNGVLFVDYGDCYISLSSYRNYASGSSYLPLKVV